MANLMVEKLREVRTGIFKQVQDKMEKVESITSNFGYTNLKIYDVSFYLYKAVDSGLITDKQANNLFNHIADIEYSHFEEWEQENLNHINRSYIFSTSSFFYNTDWYGTHIESCVIDELLAGKDNHAVRSELKELDYIVYECFVSNSMSEEQVIEVLQKRYMNDYSYDEQAQAEEDVMVCLEEVETFLEEFSDDLDELLEVVNEAKLAYDYLSEYKTQENEYEVAKNYLEHDIENHFSEEKADELFTMVLQKIAPINKVQYIDFDISEQDNKYVLNVKTNNNEFVLDTGITTEHELSKLYAECILHFIEENKKSYFIF